MFLTKTDVKKCFNISQRTKLSDEDYYTYLGFIYGVIIGNGYECKCYVRDYIPFVAQYKPYWKTLFQEHTKTGAWPVWEKGNLIWL